MYTGEEAKGLKKRVWGDGGLIDLRSQLYKILNHVGKELSNSDPWIEG